MDSYNFEVEKELLIVAFNITNSKALSELMKMWGRQRVLLDSKERKCLGRNAHETTLIKSDILGGEIILIDPENPHEIIKKIYVKTPMGMLYLPQNKMLLTASDHWISGISAGKVQSIFNNNLFNCLHWLSEGERENEFYVSSTGIDSIIKVNINNTEETLKLWLATENGFNMSPGGNCRYVDKNKNHQGIEYCTINHTVHLNSAISLGGDLCLATFFHQGELVEINMNSGNVRTLLKNLKNPHGIRKISDGFLLSDTNNNRVIILNEKYKIKNIISGNYNWIQDSLKLQNGNIVIADSNNGRIVFVNCLGKILNEWNYGVKSKRIGSLLSIKTSDAKNIFCTKEEENEI